MNSVTLESRLIKLADRFDTYAREVFAGSSPLYEQLARRVAEDEELLILAAQAPDHQPIPNLLFGAVHFLLLSGTSDRLAAFFPSVSNAPPPDTDPYPDLRAFCLNQREEIIRLISTRRVQTNEVRRCACLLPAFALVSERGRGQPLALIEIGPSAGLNLLWDRYHYDYREAGQYGDPNSPVHIVCPLRGERQPPFPHHFPDISSRMGIDLNPNDVRDDDAMLWLRALIWPEQRERADLFTRAVALAQNDPSHLIRGNALELLPELISRAAPDATLCVFDTFVMNQFSAEEREQLATLLSTQAKQRDLFHISIGIQMWPPELKLVAFEKGITAEKILARCDQHGAWLEWLDTNAER